MVRQIAPVFFTMDIPATLAYYTSKLGFACLGTWRDQPVYAIVAPEPLRYTVIPSGKTVKRRREENGYSRGVRVSALVQATPDATASRFAGRSANSTLPIPMKTTTSVKSLWTP
jgi:hypothetical protein